MLVPSTARGRRGKDGAAAGSEPAAGLAVAGAGIAVGQADGDVDGDRGQIACVERPHDVLDGRDDRDRDEVALDDPPSCRDRREDPAAAAAVETSHTCPDHAVAVAVAVAVPAQPSAAQFTWSFGVKVTVRPISSSSSTDASTAGPPSKKA